MPSSIDRIRHAQIWDLLDQYADIRDQLEDVLSSMQVLQFQFAADLEDLSADFDDLSAQIARCSHSLIRFRTAPGPSAGDRPFETHPEKVPFPDDDEPFPSPEPGEAPLLSQAPDEVREGR